MYYDVRFAPARKYPPRHKHWFVFAIQCDYLDTDLSDIKEQVLRDELKFENDLKYGTNHCTGE